MALTAILLYACSSPKTSSTTSETSFAGFEKRFLDAYWKEYPSAAIFVGYGKYYENLVVPNDSALAHQVSFSKQWIDSLDKLDASALSDNDKISTAIIRNQLESDIWYITDFKKQEWDASQYNLSGECDYIINQPYAPLNERLIILSKHLEQSDAYYRAGLQNLKTPVKEYIEMAVSQNKGGLSIFGKALLDSINASGLTAPEKEKLRANITKTIVAINNYVQGLQKILTNKNTLFKDFRIGKELYAKKFKYDLATDFTPEQAYEKAMADKKMYHEKMYKIAAGLWVKYFKTQLADIDITQEQVIRSVIDTLQKQHATPQNFAAQLTQQVHDLKKFILEKDLFDFDTVTPPVKVRLMPEYLRGFSVANAEFTPPYQKQGATYYNIDDLTKYTPEKAEGTLREYNNYSSQFLSIHEAVPGHCLQGIYNNKKSGDVLRSVFQNGAMVEGWAVYTEDMMVENGWGNHAPEMELLLYKLKLRELANVLIDYDIQVLNKPKSAVIDLLTRQCFQTAAQAEEKYHRATVSQVQLCSYYSGAAAIHALRDDYQKKMGANYKLKDFHEKFLSFGSSPVKYIRERMME